MELMTKQLEDLEAQLQSVQMECSKVDAENAILLAQAEAKEKELELDCARLESGKCADVSPLPESGGVKDDGGGNIVMVVRSCGSNVEVTKDMLSAPPRQQVESLLKEMMRRMADSVRQQEQMELALASPAAPTAQLAQIRSALSNLHAVISALVDDFLTLYGHAFRANPSDTHALESSLHPGLAPPEWAAVRDQLCVRAAQEKVMADATVRYLTNVKACMDQRKMLHQKLQLNNSTLLEWESVAVWLTNDTVINKLQETLKQEADLYLAWCSFMCLSVWTPSQAAKYLTSFPLRVLLQVCSTLLQPPPPDGTHQRNTSGGASSERHSRPNPSSAPHLHSDSGRFSQSSASAGPGAELILAELHPVDGGEQFGDRAGLPAPRDAPGMCFGADADAFAALDEMPENLDDLLGVVGNRLC